MDSSRSWQPSAIIVWEEVRRHPEVERILSLFPEAPVCYTRTQKAAVPPGASRGQVLFLGTTSEFVKPFSGKPGDRIVCRNYLKLVPISRGCPYRCAYCYLDFVYRERLPWIKMNLNYDAMLKELAASLSNASCPVSFNMGEMLDSLALDHISGLSARLVPFFARQPKGFLMLLTKSSNVAALLSLRHEGHTVVSWSLNAQDIIDRYEIGTASLRERVEAARSCQEAGYPIRYRFDPLIAGENWRSAYADMIDRTLATTRPENITIGSLRFLPGHPKLARQLHGESAAGLFQGRFVTGAGDRKRRYPPELRLEMYRFLIDRIRAHCPDMPVALCREIPEIWKALAGMVTSSACNCVIS